MSPDPRHWLTASDIDAGRPILLVPVGAWEQHGPHLPLATDAIIAEHLCRAVADRPVVTEEKNITDVTEIIVAPTITVSASDEHQRFAGTLSFGTEATATALVAMVRSAWWARGVVLVNGHGGNADALAVVRAAFTDTANADVENKVSLWWPRTPAVYLPAMATDLHAGHLETSVMLHLVPQLVRRDLIPTDVAPHDATHPGLHDDVSALLAALREHGVDGVSPTGVIGNPGTANATDGADIWEHWVNDLARHIAQLATSWS